MTKHLLCCDWGTSAFRLRLMTTDEYRCLGEINARSGVAGTFADWKTTGEPNGVSREQFFRRQLSTYIHRLAGQLGRNLAEIPVIISGMASSSIGMADVPYATLPFATDGSQCSIRHYDQQADFPHEISLIAGVRSQRDVMRGEETQLIGLLSLLNPTDWQTRPSTFIFPGTHSKHIAVQNEQLVKFDTYMTGELFDLMAHQSILADSVDVRGLAHLSASDATVFRQGVRESVGSPLLSSLFTVRTNQLFNKLTKRQNTLYLSGLLIGSELENLSHEPDWQLVLCSGSNLAAFYEWAIHELQLSSRSIIVPPDLTDQAASVGQVRLYQLQQLKPTTK